MSHHGRGLELREAGKTAAVQFCEVMRRDGVANPRALPGVPIVEAFPNTFLGVLLPAQTFDGSGTLKIRTRSDRLYEAATGQGALQRLLEDLDWSEPGTAERFARERDHDIRAALVCLLTAGFASAGTAAIVGDGIGGWFWLPPLGLWAEWAVAALKTNLVQAQRRGYPEVSLMGESV